ncbi:MAG: hypothetical protein H7Z75_02000 [Ferruginibacter sp.]|nr:hypothetical protein [Cytophagales bacterium]
MRKPLLLALITTILAACDGPSLLSPCGGKDEFEGSIYFSVYDKGSQAQLLGIYGRYNINDGKVLDQQGNVVVPGPIELSGNIYLYYLNRDTD